MQVIQRGYVMTNKYTRDDLEIMIAPCRLYTLDRLNELFSAHKNHPNILFASANECLTFINKAYKEGLDEGYRKGVRHGKDIGIAEERLKNPTTRTNLKDM